MGDQWWATYEWVMLALLKGLGVAVLIDALILVPIVWWHRRHG